MGLPQASASSDQLAEVYSPLSSERSSGAALLPGATATTSGSRSGDWASVVESIEMLDEEARAVGLTLNDSKTVPYHLQKYADHLTRGRRGSSSSCRGCVARPDGLGDGLRGRADRDRAQ